MKHLADIAVQPLIGSEPPMTNTGKPPVEAFRRLVPLWEHMTGIYGPRWTSGYGAEVSETWVRGLRGFDTEDLARGLEHCLDWNGNDGWPPNLKQFRSMCRPPKPPTYYKGLPTPPLSPAQQQAITDERAKIRSVLRHARKQEKREAFDLRQFRRISTAAARVRLQDEAELLKHARIHRDDITQETANGQH